MKWVCRLLGSADLTSLVEIAQESLVPVWSAKDYEYFLTHPQAFNWGLFSDNHELLCFILSLRTHQEVDIASIACRKSYRRKGLAAYLLSHFLNESQREQAFLEVDLTNEAAVKLYLSHGFQVVGRRKKYYEGKRDAWIMSWAKTQ